MGRWIDRVCRVLEGVIAAMLAVMVVLVFGNVVLRYGFNSGITVSEEVSRWLFIWMTFLGAIVALREHGHLGVDMVVQKLPPAGKKICLAIGHLVMLGIVGLLFQGSLAQARINWDVTAPTTGASMAIVYASAIVFAVMAAIILLLDLFRLLTGRIADADLVMVQESEEAVQLRQILGEHPVGAIEASASPESRADAPRKLP
ncbi:TRAP transporter small permease [Variovorax sp. PvP013]|uniref:TRAP transporter small permease n=1 Tax=Variovorax sp. PvP013 TaxID=3156435 RepID=UPI003D20576C